MALQIQFRVSGPDGLIGLWWVPESSQAVSGDQEEDTVSTRPPSLPGVAQRDTVTWSLGIKCNERS